MAYGVTKKFLKKFILTTAGAHIIYYAIFPFLVHYLWVPGTEAKRNWVGHNLNRITIILKKLKGLKIFLNFYFNPFVNQIFCNTIIYATRRRMNFIILIS